MITDDHLSKEIQSAENERKLEQFKTTLKKSQFIDEIKAGLGAEIKSNPGRVKIIKKKWYQKLGIALKSLFTKF